MPRVAAEHFALTTIPVENSRDYRDECGLAAARWADQHEQFAPVNVEIDTA